MRGQPAGREGGAALYGLAAVVYVALGVWFGGLVLNWIVGPLFPFLVVYLLPRAVQRMRVGRAAAAMDDIPGTSGPSDPVRAMEGATSESRSHA